MKARWWYLAFFVVVGVSLRLAESRQGRGVLLIGGLAAVLGVAIAWLSRSGSQTRSSERDMSNLGDTPIDDHMLP